MATSKRQLTRDLPGLPSHRRDQVVRRIARDHHVRRATAERWFEELDKFLNICAFAGAPVSPPSRVDKAWHTFILFTRDYASYCASRHGIFIHHDPYEKSDAQAYERAYRAAQARHGDLPRAIWPAPGTQSGGWGIGGGCGGGGCGGGGC
jgi:hypothetical protein